MDSEVQRDGRILDLIDDAWREDKLPYEDVTIPLVSDSQNGAGGVPGRHPGKAEKPRRWLFQLRKPGSFSALLGVC